MERGNKTGCVGSKIDISTIRFSWESLREDVVPMDCFPAHIMEGHKDFDNWPVEDEKNTTEEQEEKDEEREQMFWWVNNY